MASISLSTGLGSGLDISGMVSQLMQIERQPLNAINTKISTYNSQISDLGKLKSDLSSFESAASSLTDVNPFNVYSASSSNSNTVTATADTSAAAGTYAVNVTKLAQAEVLRSTAIASSTTGLGNAASTLTFNLHKAGVAADPANNKVVNIDANSSLEQMRDAVNAAGVGVTAAVVQDSSGYRLTYTANEVGASNGIQVTAGDGSLNFLAFDPSLPWNMERKQTLTTYNEPTGSESLLGNAAGTLKITGTGALNDGLSINISANVTKVALAQQLNASALGQYFTAAVNSSTGALSLTAKQEGSATLIAGISLDNSASALGTGAGLEFLTYSNASSIATSTPTASGMGQTSIGHAPAATSGGSMGVVTHASDAEVTVNGVSVVSSGNKVTNAATGVTFNASQIGAATITVSRDDKSINEKVQKFVDGYNKIMDTTTSLRSGSMKGDSTVLSIQSKLLNELYKTPTGLGAPVSAYTGAARTVDGVSVTPVISALSQIGISVDKNGKMTFDKDAFKSELEKNPTVVTNLFSYQNGSDLVGFADRMKTAVQSLTEPSTGLVDGRIQSARESVRMYEDRKSSVEYRLTLTEARLNKQFQTMDSYLSKMKDLSSYISNQLR